jgi:hypothetical protein
MQVFKLEHLPSWGRIVTAFQAMIRLLRKYNIKSATVRGNILLSIDSVNRKMSEADIMKCFVNRQVFEKVKSDHRKKCFRRNNSLAALSIQQNWLALTHIQRLRKA